MPSAERRRVRARRSPSRGFAATQRESIRQMTKLPRSTAMPRRGSSPRIPWQPPSPSRRERLPLRKPEPSAAQSARQPASPISRSNRRALPMGERFNLPRCRLAGSSPSRARLRRSRASSAERLTPTQRHRKKRRQSPRRRHARNCPQALRPRSKGSRCPRWTCFPTPTTPRRTVHPKSSSKIQLPTCKKRLPISISWPTLSGGSQAPRSRSSRSTFLQACA